MAYRDQHLIANIANVGRAAIRVVLDEGEKRFPGRLAASLRDRPHIAHMTAHALALLLQWRKAAEPVWRAVGDGIEPVCPDTARLLRIHADNEFKRGGKPERHLLHALANGAMQVARQSEPSWCQVEEEQPPTP